MIKLLIFDADGILWKVSEKDLEKAMERFFRKYKIDGKVINSRWIKVRKKVETGKIKYDKAVDIQFKGFRVNKKILKDWHDIHFNLRGISIKFDSSIIPVLKELKKRYKLAVLTNDVKNYKYKEKICKRLGMSGIFERIFSSSDIDYMKPHKKAFLTVTNYFKVKCNEVVFVAHSKDELEGARKHKIKTIAYKWDKGAKSDFYIKSFSEIPKILEKIK
jgi:FMN phosphatase YigB (HAD superfamily)